MRLDSHGEPMKPPTKRFGMNDQLMFAALSGDGNPIHVDPIASRRTQMGAPVVHGVHLLLWALDSALSSCPIDLTSVATSFKKPVYVGEEVSLTTTTRDGKALLDISIEATVVASVSVGARAARPGNTRERDLPGRASTAWPEAPLDLQLADIADRHGVLPLEDRPAGLGRAFPSLVQHAGEARVAALLSLSRLVGMVCPGLHSIFSSLDVTFTEAEAPRPLSFHVIEVDDRFRRVRMAIDGSGVRGLVEAFARQPPTVQPSIRDVAGHVRPDAFAGASALVVGGSRGLGEVAAKLLAAGGATPVITYSVGRSDAERVAAEIEASGRPCHVRRLDVTGNIADQMGGWPTMPDTLYYFATSFIARRPVRLFDGGIFAEFVKFYVTGFHDVTEVMMRLSGRPLRAFYPSSVFVVERPRHLTEYAMAKMAGEGLCADLDRYRKDLTIIVRRLPRLLTDQTATVYPAKMEPILATMADVVAATQGTAATGPADGTRSAPP